MAIPYNNRVIVDIAGQPVRLYPSKLLLRYALIQALPTNTGVIVIGDENVIADSTRRNSITILTGEEFQFDKEFGTWDLYNWWMDSTVSGEGIAILGYY